MRSVRREIRCVRCGADLRGYRAVEDCPECGTRVVESAHAATGPEDAGRCAVCLEDLHGVSHRRRCPECRTPVRLGLVGGPDAPQVRERGLFPEGLENVRDGRVTSDRAIGCISCTYDLRGLRPDAACPECGTAVRRTLARGSLRFASPKYLRRTRLGSALVTGSAAAVLLMFVLHIALSWFFGLLGLGSWVAGSLSMIFLIWGVLLFAAPLVYAAGIYLVTGEDPEHRREAMIWSRIAAVGGVPAALVGYWLASRATALHGSAGGGFSRAASLDVVIRLLPTLALLLSLVSVLQFIRLVGARALGEGLRARPRAMLRSLPVAMLPLLAWAASPAIHRLPNAAVQEWLDRVWLISGLFGLGWLCTYFGLFSVLRRIAGRALEEQRDAADKEEPSATSRVR